MTLETGKIAKQAAGSVTVTFGDTVVLVTAVHSKPRAGIDFFPLTVDFVEKFAAAGKIPGGFFKREGRLADREVLVSRFIDRSIRPLFADGYNDDTQVTATVLSHDPDFSADMCAFVGASAALSISEIPFLGPIAAVRIARCDGDYVINPVPEDLEESDLELIVAGNEKSIVMVEGGAKQLPEDEVLAALKHAHNEIKPIIEAIDAFAKKVGKTKIVMPEAADNSDLEKRIEKMAGERLTEAFQIKEKKARADAVKSVEKEIRQEIWDEYRNEKMDSTTLADFEARSNGLKSLQSNVKNILHDLGGELMRERVMATGERIDGRKSNEIRQIACEIRPYPRPHGVALFTRGETQAVVTATLGSGFDEQTIDGMGGRWKKNFMLHYNFPPFSVGEARPLRGPGRREVGHGTLAERAITPVLPDHDDFPYTLRVVSETLESNGSSSMAAVCGSTLSLLDAGVPLKAPVAGIAMGLIKEDDGYAVLSDILGDEDHLGDMDFKVAGSAAGITSLQMDIKITSITPEIMQIALDQAKDGRIHILGEMAKSIDTSRNELSQHAPRITTMTVPTDKIRDVIGTGGKVIREICEVTGCKVDIDDEGLIKVASSDGEAAQKAIDWITSIVAEPEVGVIYNGKVVKVVDFGAFVNFFGARDGLVHISELKNERVGTVTDVINEGDEVKVKVIGMDDRGKVKLSMRVVDQETGEELEDTRPPREPREGGDDDRPRRPRRPRRED